ncbi:MAG: AbrB/MazE/SpoVT family DNA-binding domain-containing protein [Spirochaetales bacterium]|nr:AbrB/MazE/SpoVT family DNA-binding domain-containing protein [Spirochaetales bacterium]
MTTILKKWGNSLGIRIPTIMAKDLALEDGSEVEVVEEENQIIIRKKEKPGLDFFLDQINETNLHTEVDFGRQEGNEVW